jgi:uncharacterized protein (DUF3084 family)
MSKPNIADAVQAIQIAAAKQALQDVTEAVAEMEIEIARLRAELKTSNAERDEARLGLLQERGDDMNANQPICKTCGVLWVDHMGIQGTCAENAKLRKERDEARRERDLALEERDEARRLYCQTKHPPTKHCGITEDALNAAKWLGWDCFKEEETP